MATDEITWQDRQREHLFFTWTQQAGVRGLEITDAKGAKFEVEGHGWVWDLESQVYNVNVGHRHPHVQQRMIEQIERLPACAPNAVLPIRAELGSLLAEHTGLHRAFLTTGGSEAVENAIKMARLVTGRGKIVTRRNSYHGATLTVLGIAGDARKDPYVEHLAPAHHIEDAVPIREGTEDLASNWLESFDELLVREGPDSIAAVLLEGFTGTNGMQHPPADFWPGVRERCDRHGILLIDDEIFAGFGRTGKWFAREHWGVAVDMMTIGKGLTSGYAPLAGVMVSEAIARRFEREKLWCGLTHYAHPVGCAAAVGAIEVTQREGLVANADAVGGKLRDGLERLASAHAAVREVRGLGMMLAMEFDRPCAELVSQLWGARVYAPFRENTLFVCPPLCMTADEADTVLELISAGVRGWLASP